MTDIKKKKKQGTSIIEFIIYVSVLTLMSAVVVTFLVRVIQSYAIIRIDRNLSQGTAVIFERIFNEIRHASNVYIPTTSGTQLSLKTSLEPPTDEIFTYVDYYLDNNVIWEKREGGVAIPISGGNVVVNAFDVTRFYSNNAEGVRINLELTTPIQNSSLTRTFSWTSSSTLRGY